MEIGGVCTSHCDVCAYSKSHNGSSSTLKMEDILFRNKGSHEDTSRMHALRVTIDQYQSEIARLENLMKHEHRNTIRREALRLTQEIVTTSNQGTDDNPYTLLPGTGGRKWASRLEFPSPMAIDGNGESMFQDEDEDEDEAEISGSVKDEFGFSINEIPNSSDDDDDDSNSNSRTNTNTNTNTAPNSLLMEDDDEDDGNGNDDNFPVPAIFHQQQYRSTKRPRSENDGDGDGDGDGGVSDDNGTSMLFTTGLSDKQRITLVRAYIRDNMPPSSTWTKKTDQDLKQATRGKGGSPNRKYSRTIYSDRFLNFVSGISSLLAKCPSRVYRMRVDPLDRSKTVCNPNTDQFKPNNGMLRIPGDYRCVGCRRYFKTRDSRRCKNLAFHLCGCDECRASHCMECRVLQWCLKMAFTTTAITTNDGNSPTVVQCFDEQGALKRVECSGNGCRTCWSLEDLFVLSMHRTGEDERYEMERTKKERERKRLKKMREKQQQQQQQLYK